MTYITAYNQDWPERFVRIAGHISIFLPDSCTIHHVGSTSVPGMPAKDIIDLDIAYAKGILQKVITALREAGYEHRGDMGIPGRDVFKPVPNSRAASLPAHHLYACENDAYELKKHLSFRNYLRAYPRRAEWLSKKKLAAQASAKTKEEYIENKSRYYEEISKEAMKWAGKNEKLGSEP